MGANEFEARLKSLDKFFSEGNKTPDEMNRALDIFIKNTEVFQKVFDVPEQIQKDFRRDLPRIIDYFKRKK